MSGHLRRSISARRSRASAASIARRCRTSSHTCASWPRSTRCRSATRWGPPRRSTAGARRRSPRSPSAAGARDDHAPAPVDVCLRRNAAEAFRVSEPHRCKACRRAYNAQRQRERRRPLVCAFGTPWLDHFAPPIGTGRGCVACQTPRTCDDDEAAAAADSACRVRRRASGCRPPATARGGAVRSVCASMAARRPAGCARMGGGGRDR